MPCALPVHSPTPFTLCRPPSPLPANLHVAAGEPVPAALENDGAPDFLNVGLVYLHSAGSGYGGTSGATGYILK